MIKIYPSFKTYIIAFVLSSSFPSSSLFRHSFDNKNVVVRAEDWIPPLIGTTDDAGYTMCPQDESSIGYQWINIRDQPGTKSSIDTELALDFAFPFYGTTYDKVIATDEGFLYFDMAFFTSSEGKIESTSFAQCGIPTDLSYDGDMPSKFIAPFNEPLHETHDEYERAVCHNWVYDYGYNRQRLLQQRLQDLKRMGNDMSFNVDFNIDVGNDIDSEEDSNYIDGAGNDDQPEEQQENVLHNHHQQQFENDAKLDENSASTTTDTATSRNLEELYPTEAPTQPRQCIYVPISSSTAFYHKNFNECPIGDIVNMKCAVLEWYNYSRDNNCVFNQTLYTDVWLDRINFQAILFENGNIHFQYKSAADDGTPIEGDYSNCQTYTNYFTYGETVVGIQGSSTSSPTWGLEYTCQTQDLYSGLAISFQAPGNDGTACQIPTPEPSPEPTASSQPTSSVCTEQGLDIACIFNEQDQDNKGFTTICVKNVEDDGYVRYRNTCKRNDLLAGLVPGDIVPNMEDDSTLVGCGCCDRCNVQADTHNRQYGEYAKYCHRAVCTPESDPDNWMVCEAWGNGIVNTIKLCITHEDGSEEEVCADPFFIPEKASDTVRCGNCISAA